MICEINGHREVQSIFGLTDILSPDSWFACEFKLYSMCCTYTSSSKNFAVIIM